MLLNGYQLQQLVREAKADRDQWAAQFEPSLKAFPGEDKPSPKQASGEFMLAEMKLAKLQVLQTRYNLAVTVNALGSEMTLLEAIKRVGGAGRHEKMWRSAAAPKRDRYYHEESTRDKDAVVATRQVSYADAASLRKEAAQEASELRAAIQMGNAQSIELEVEDGLLEA
jgi:hypothetical protein